MNLLHRDKPVYKYKISDITQLATYHIPELAFEVFAVKDIRC